MWAYQAFKNSIRFRYEGGGRIYPLPRWKSILCHGTITPCPFEGKIGKAASEHWKKYDKLRPDFAQYTERLNVIQNIKETEKKEKELAIWKSKLESKKDVSEEDKKELDKLQEEIKALEAEIDYDKKKVQDKTLNQK